MSSERKILIEIDDFTIVDFVCYFIVKAETGVFYTSQSGGVSCQHPEFEGFIIPIGGNYGLFNDCALGCQYIGFDSDTKKKAAIEIDKWLTNTSKDFSYKISFDFDNIHSLMEGWWPVKYSGRLSGKQVELTGILVTGNCD